VFYIALENHDFVQTAPGHRHVQLYGNSAAPFINSLVTPGNPNAAQTSFALNYQDVSPTLYPAQPNYIWTEAGIAPPNNTNHQYKDENPYQNKNNIVNAPNLSGLLQQKYGTSGWRSYQEDTDLLNTMGQNVNSAGGTLTSTVASPSQYETPLTSLHGTSADYVNPYNGSHQYYFVPWHDGQLYFADTNGGDNRTSSNPEAGYYAPLQQLTSDLADNTVARYNWITPDEYNDMHSPLNTNFTYDGVTYQAGTYQETIALADNFLSIVVPEIMSSQAYKNNGLIVIWNDQTEGDKQAGHTHGFDGTEIIISPLAKGDAYSNDAHYTHSSDLRTMQEIFGVLVPGGGYLGGAADASDLSDLFQPGVIPPRAFGSSRPADPTPPSSRMMSRR
jgi:phosphatidylinositol-3-phosphatase